MQAAARRCVAGFSWTGNGGHDAIAAARPHIGVANEDGPAGNVMNSCGNSWSAITHCIDPDD